MCIVQYLVSGVWVCINVVRVDVEGYQGQSSERWRKHWEQNVCYLQPPRPLPSPQKRALNWKGGGMEHIVNFATEPTLLLSLFFLQQLYSGSKSWDNSSICNKQPS